ncbi:MAG: CotH kinase family protein [Clostridiales bacterium]|jgi:hypothetical protein|nr:CotH kinase family protein [Clostridiales bacterium]
MNKQKSIITLTALVLLLVYAVFIVSKLVFANYSANYSLLTTNYIVAGKNGQTSDSKAVKNGSEVYLSAQPDRFGYVKNWYYDADCILPIGSSSILIEKSTVIYIKYDFDFLLPTIVINTNGAPILDKENYVAAAISLLNCPNPEFVILDADAGIRLRGNSTLGMPKKPYRIKFDSKTSVFGRKKEKSWVLLANYADKALMRNYLAYNSYALLDGDAFTPLTVFVDVYLNGEYCGVYMLTDQISVGTDRVDITNDTTDDTGYLLEQDYRAPNEGTENIDYFSVDGMYFNIRSPNPDDELLPSQVAYIKAYIESVNNAIKSGNFENINALIDVDSFIKYFMIQEIFKNTDIGGLSIFMYKDKNEKLFMGPVWDFDISAGNSDYIDYAPQGLWAQTQNPWFSRLMNVDEFRKHYVDYFFEAYDATLLQIPDMVMQTYNTYREAFERNFEKWDILNIYVWPNPSEVVAADTVEKQVLYLKEYLLNRLEWLNEFYSQYIE